MDDYRLTAARNYLATAPDSDFSRLLADVLTLTQDYMEMALDESITQVLLEGGIYFCKEDVRRLCPECMQLATSSEAILSAVRLRGA